MHTVLENQTSAMSIASFVFKFLLLKEIMKEANSLLVLLGAKSRSLFYISYFLASLRQKKINYYARAEAFYLQMLALIKTGLGQLTKKYLMSQALRLILFKQMQIF